MMPTPPPTFKVAFIGTHGVGKTTLTYGLASRLKARDFALEVVVEVARRCPMPLNEETTVAAQSWILHTQVADELAASARYPIVLCDRSVLDNYVYLLLAHGAIPALDRLVARWTETYDLLIHVPLLAGERVMEDGTRSVDPSFRLAVDQRLRAELERRGIESLQLDTAERERWLAAAEAAVVARLRPPQLELSLEREG